MSDGLNDARAIRVAEIMSDFQGLQYFLSRLSVSPTAEEYYLEGYSLLRECRSEGETSLMTPFQAASTTGGADLEREKLELRTILVDAAVRRFQCYRAYLRAQAGLRWVEARNIILQGQRPNASHLTFLQEVDTTLRMELQAITDSYVESQLRAQDAAQGRWLAEDPSLAQIQQRLMSR